MKRLALLLALLASPAAAQPVPEAVAEYGRPDAATRLLVQGTTDIDAFAPLVERFVAARPDLALRYEQWGSNDLYATAAAACATGEGAADLVVSSSVDQMVKLVNDGCARAYRSTWTAALPPELNWRDEVFGITREPAVIVYNRRLVPVPPVTRFDLIDLLRPEAGPVSARVATYDIETSGLGYLFAFMDSLQATTYGSLIEALGRSGAVATCCSAEIIGGVESGDYAIAYNVLGSYALARAAQNPDLAVVAPRDYTLVLSRAAMIPDTAAHPAEAGTLVDFLLSPPGRAALAATYLIVEDEPGGPLELGGDDVFLRPIPLSPLLLVGLDAAKREQFRARWRAIFPLDGTP